MKKQILTSLVIAALSASAFALPQSVTQVSPAPVVAEDGSDRVGVNRIAEGGADRVGLNRVAEDGSDRVGVNRIAEDGADRVGANRLV
ncbi:hypothetical protein [Pseudomonas sp. NCCP-436]|uniref:hypothetical protein n=1 Tax=Pseudomonas sp. NCCP-436 TaxID=2842481 RepID=UPI001C7F7109|nr:hypothetical protein [Pseudomonas sp. NCCP-436]GIZ12630.1 hypothetical protein NCCP436_20460 [Pseudomonas sp. NCCP-436]